MNKEKIVMIYTRIWAFCFVGFIESTKVGNERLATLFVMINVVSWGISCVITGEF